MLDHPPEYLGEVRDDPGGLSTPEVVTLTVGIIAGVLSTLMTLGLALLDQPGPALNPGDKVPGSLPAGWAPFYVLFGGVALCAALLVHGNRAARVLELRVVETILAVALPWIALGVALALNSDGV